MKMPIKSIVFILSIFVVSCSKPTDMLTVINDDGSCYREFTATANPKFLLGDTTTKLNPFPIEIDSTWEIQWKYGNSEIRKDFPISKATYDSIFKVENATDFDNKKMEVKLKAKVTLSVNGNKSVMNYTDSTQKSIQTKLSKLNKIGNVKVSVYIKSHSPVAQPHLDSLQKKLTLMEDSLQNEMDSIVNNQKKSGDATIKLLVTARRHYASVEEMGKQFKFKPAHAWKNKKVVYCLDKKFRWFYTYFTYSETYSKVSQKLEIPIEKYLTKAEADFWFNGKKDLIRGMNGVEIREFSGKIEDKYNIWFAHNSWNAEYKVLLENYHKIAHQPVSIEQLKELRDTIFPSKKNDLQNLKMNIVLNDYFNTDAFSVLWKMKNSPMKAFEENYNIQLMSDFAESFNYKLIMPGKIIESNDAIIQSDTLSWRLTSYRMVQNDYKIEAQSRVANIWIFILSGLIGIFALGSFMWKPKK